MVNKVFDIQGDKHAIVDKVRSQWAMYQLEDIPEKAYKISEEIPEKSMSLLIL